MNELYPACSPLSLRGGTAGCGSTWLQSPIICEADRCHNWHRMAPVFTGAGIRRQIGFRSLSFVRVSETKTLRTVAAEKREQKPAEERSVGRTEGGFLTNAVSQELLLGDISRSSSVFLI